MQVSFFWRRLIFTMSKSNTAFIFAVHWLLVKTKSRIDLLYSLAKYEYAPREIHHNPCCWPSYRNTPHVTMMLVLLPPPPMQPMLMAQISSATERPYRCHRLIFAHIWLEYFRIGICVTDVRRDRSTLPDDASSSVGTSTAINKQEQCKFKTTHKPHDEWRMKKVWNAQWQYYSNKYFRG